MLIWSCGNAHQIRTHLALEARLPLLGDRKYGQAADATHGRPLAAAVAAAAAAAVRASSMHMGCLQHNGPNHLGLCLNQAAAAAAADASAGELVPTRLMLHAAAIRESNTCHFIPPPSSYAWFHWLYLLRIFTALFLSLPARRRVRRWQRDSSRRGRCAAR